MLKEKHSLVVVVMLTALILVVGNRELISGGGGPGVPEPWAIEYPSNGQHIQGSPPAFLGTGPANSLAALSIFEEQNSNPAGVYASELTLRRNSYVNTEYFALWNADPFGWNGTWFACVLPATPGGGLNDPPFTQDPTTPEVDIRNICASLGGSGVSYDIAAGPSM